MFYQAFRDNAIINMAMAGMLCGVAAVIFDVVINMAKTVFLQKRMLPVFVLLGVFSATRFWNINIIAIILICGMIGAIDVCFQRRARRAGNEE